MNPIAKVLLALCNETSTGNLMITKRNLDFIAGKTGVDKATLMENCRRLDVCIV